MLIEKWVMRLFHLWISNAEDPSQLRNENPFLLIVERLPETCNPNPFHPNPTAVHLHGANNWERKMRFWCGLFVYEKERKCKPRFYLIPPP